MRNNIFKYSIKPYQPFQIEQKPIAPDYSNNNAWILRNYNQGDIPIFFIHPTTYYNGKLGWNADLNQVKANERITTNIIPNYIGPFARQGTIFAPKYRQASLYATQSFNIDTNDALNLAYSDVNAAFAQFQKDIGDKPFIIVGYGQGALHAMRLINEVIANTENEKKLLSAYLINQPIPKELFDKKSNKMFGDIKICKNNTDLNCIVTYNIIDDNDETNLKIFQNRAAYWSQEKTYAPLMQRELTCYNPLSGNLDSKVEAIQNLGSVNATNFSLEDEPPLFKGEADAKCEDGMLKTDSNRIKDLKPMILELGSFYKTPNYNLFYKSLENDIHNRIAFYNKQK